MESTERPWGSYMTLSGGDDMRYKVKKIIVLPYKKLSLQSHYHRNEHWTIVSGIAKVQVNDEISILNANDYIYIPKKALHRIENVGTKLLEFIEVQTGEYLGEDDINRYEDDYGRV